MAVDRGWDFHKPTDMLGVAFQSPLWIIVGISPCLILIARRAWQSRTTHRDGIPRPPLVGNWTPYLGSAISMTKGDRFWEQSEAVYGSAFRILAMGDEKIFTTNQGIITWIYKNSKTCDFPWYRKHLSNTVYGMNRSTCFLDIWDDQIFAMHHRALSPKMLEGLIHRYVDQLEIGLSERMARFGEGVMEVDLVDWIYEIIYVASSKAFFSPNFPSVSSIPAFKGFDQAFPLLLLDTLPSFARKPAARARQAILDIIHEWVQVVKNDPSSKDLIAESLRGMIDVGEQEGWGDEDLMGMALAELWALEANAPFAGIWTVLEIARRPELYSSLYDEITAAIVSCDPPTLSSLLRLGHGELPAKVPELNAAFQETLRFHTYSFSIRKIKEDMVIPSSLIDSGVGKTTGLSMAKDEQIVCVTRAKQVSVDSRLGGWGYNADLWDYNRFLKNDGKIGQMWPFGGGTSMCEGRHFASVEILTFLISFIAHLRVEIVSDTMQADMTRIGLGMIQPKGECKIKLIRR